MMKFFINRGIIGNLDLYLKSVGWPVEMPAILIEKEACI